MDVDVKNCRHLCFDGGKDSAGMAASNNMNNANANANGPEYGQVWSLQHSRCATTDWKGYIDETWIMPRKTEMQCPRYNRTVSCGHGAMRRTWTSFLMQVRSVKTV